MEILRQHGRFTRSCSIIARDICWCLFQASYRYWIVNSHATLFQVLANLCKVSSNKLFLRPRGMEIYACLSSSLSLHSTFPSVDGKIINLLTMSSVCHCMHVCHDIVFGFADLIDIGATRNYLLETAIDATSSSWSPSLSPLHPKRNLNGRLCNYFNCSFVLLNGFQFTFSCLSPLVSPFLFV